MARPYSSLSLLFALSLTTGAAAQVGIHVGAGAAVPVGQFGSGASTGWMVQGRLLVPIQRGLSVALGGFYETNDREPVYPEHGDASKVAALMGGLLFRPGNPAKPGVFFSWELGWLKYYGYEHTHKYIAFTGGAGVAVPVSTLVELSLSGSYYGVVLDSAVAFWSIMTGVRFRLGGKEG